MSAPQGIRTQNTFSCVATNAPVACLRNNSASYGEREGPSNSRLSIRQMLFPREPVDSIIAADSNAPRTRRSVRESGLPVSSASPTPQPFAEPHSIASGGLV